MKYTKKYLDQFKQKENFGTGEHQSITEDLINLLTTGQELSLAEEDYICSALSTMFTDNPGQHIDVSTFNGCKNYWFCNRYLLYFKDLEACGKIFDFRGEINSDQKNKDRIFLETEYKNWLQIINSKTTGDNFVDYISKETKHHIKLINKYSNSMQIAHPKQDYLLKSIVLHSRYIYFLVKEYFQELGTQEVKIELFGQTILIDCYSSIHILFRHFASYLKEHQNDKSYHYDVSIHHKGIPDFLTHIINCYKETCDSKAFDNQSINFTYNDIPYTIWFRRVNIYKPKNIIETYLRVQTLYPVESNLDKQRLNKLLELKHSKELTFLIKMTNNNGQN